VAALTDRLEYVLGKKAADPLAAHFGMRTVNDLLRHYPRKYSDGMTVLGEGEELVSLSSHGLTENLHRWNTRHRRIGRMGMEMDQGHSTTPSISNGLLSKPDVEGVESDGEPLRPLLLMLLIDGSSLKERALLGIAG